MKKNLLIPILLIAMVGAILLPLTSKAEGDKTNKPVLNVWPSQLKIRVDRSYDLKANFIDGRAYRVEDKCTWQVFPDSLGSFKGTTFTALKTGKGIIVGNYQAYSDTIDIDVWDVVKEPEKEEQSRYPLLVFNENKVLKLSVGESKKSEVTYFEAKDKPTKVVAEFQVIPAILGNITNDGLFNAEYPGNGFIVASYNNLTAKRHVLVEKSKKDLEVEYPLLKIVTPRVNLEVGENVELMAVYYDAEGKRTIADAEWMVTPSFLGHFNDSVFVADSVGAGFIYATFESLIDSIPVKIKSESVPDTNRWEGKLVVLPSDTQLTLGSIVQYSAQILKREEKGVIKVEPLDNSTLKWTLVGNKIGEITPEGLLTVTAAGIGVVKVQTADGRAATTRVIVSKKTNSSDSTGSNIATIHRVLPNGNILPPKRIAEGKSFMITGLPFPLNVLNGGMLHFPVGSLKENVSIYMMLPEKIKDDSLDVTMSDSVFAGVKFVVTVNDIPVEPYYFEIPLNLSLVYKNELLDSLGIPVEQIGMFFDKDGDYTKAGITNITIDTVKNRIFADVEHFSSLVVRWEKSAITAVSSLISNRNSLVVKPNPFRTYTAIDFQLERDAQVTLDVYNLNGKRIQSIHANTLKAGAQSLEWNGTDKTGTVVPAGIYIGRLNIAGESVRICKMIKE